MIAKFRYWILYRLWDLEEWINPTPYPPEADIQEAGDRIRSRIDARRNYPCPICGGSGSVPVPDGDRVVCPFCLGEGTDIVAARRGMTL